MQKIFVAVWGITSRQMWNVNLQKAFSLCGELYETCEERRGEVCEYRRSSWCRKSVTLQCAGDGKAKVSSLSTFIFSHSTGGYQASIPNIKNFFYGEKVLRFAYPSSHLHAQKAFSFPSPAWAFVRLSGRLQSPRRKMISINSFEIF